MAIAVASTSQQVGFNNGSTTIDKPSGLTEGDLMIAIIGGDEDGGFATPSGWTALAGRHIEDNGRIGSFAKVADSSDVAASNFTFVTSNQYSGGMLYRITDHAGLSLVQSDDSDGGFDDLSSYGSKSLLIGGYLVLDTGLGSISDYTATGSPTFTERYDQSVSPQGREITLGIADAIYSSPVTVTDFSATYSNSADQTVSIIILVPEQEDASGTTTLLEVGPTFFGVGGASDTAGTTTLLEVSPSFNELSGEVENPKWFNQDKSSTEWTNQNKS